jgi:chromosome partitioning protein
MIIVLANNKGGVGKTTISVNLASGLAAAGYPTLLIDGDDDRCTTDYFGGRGFEAAHVGKRTIADVVLAPAGGVVGAVLPPVDLSAYAHLLPPHLRCGDPQPLHIVAGTQELADAPAAWANVHSAPVSKFEHAVRHALRQAEGGAQSYPFVIVDMGPGWNPVTRSFLVAADSVIIPLEPAKLSIEALGRVRGRIDRIASSRESAGAPAQLAIDGVLLSRFRPERRTQQAHAEGLRQACAQATLPFLQCPIVDSELVEAAADQRLPVWAIAPSDPASQAFFQLIGHVIASRRAA